MTTENENWQGAFSSSESTGANHEGNQTNKETGYTRVAYNRDGNARPYRPRFNPNAENAGRSQRAYSSDRPYRPRFNPNAENGERPQRPYNQERSYNQERPYN
ncbi:MAG TPA: pseudouridine synthase, partial [Candidatus Bacteroides pullicola]|nr:pseudouridine synthase [Candidatus Bacteroides pullicola]